MLLAIAASAVAVTVSPAGAVTGNFVPDNTHNYVVLIAFYDKNGDFLWRCSGSLLNEKTVLTAGHCTDTKSGAVSAIVWASQEGGKLFTRPPVPKIPTRATRTSASTRPRSRVPPRTRCGSTVSLATSSCMGTIRTSAC